MENMKILWNSYENYGNQSFSPKTQILEKVTVSSFFNADTSTRAPGAQHSGHFMTAIRQTKTNIKRS